MKNVPSQSISDKSKVSAILVTRQTGGLGDLLMITPTIRAIAEHNSGVPIIVSLTDKSSLGTSLPDILKNNPYVNKVISAKNLIDYSFIKVYNLGTGREIGLETDANYHINNRIDIFSKLAGVTLSDKKPIYNVTKEEKKWANSWIEKHIDPKRRRLVGLQYSTSTFRRNWPVEKQKLLAFQLVNKYKDVSILVFSDKKIDDYIYPNFYYIEGMPIRRVAAIINECELMILPDSGLLHLSGALDKKIVALFGSISPNSRICYYENAVGVWLNYPCGKENCWYSRCFSNFKCMNIPVDTVMEKADRFLESSFEVGKRKKEVCVIRMGGIGDLIMLSSALKSYLFQHPDTNITLATGPYNISIFKNSTFLTNVINISDVYNFNFDKVIDLRWRVESPEVGGSLDTNLYKSVNRIDMFEKLLGLEPSAEKFPEIIVDADKVKDIKKRIKYSSKKKYLAIQVTCTSNTRTIPPEFIQELVEKFSKVENLYLIIFGKTEFWGGRKPIVDLKAIKVPNMTNLIDSLDLPEMIALCSVADFIIGPDSSAIHIAGALGKKALALFGNINPYVRIFYYPTVKAIYPKNELDCSPCWDFTNPCSKTKEIGGACMRLLTPQRIFEAGMDWFSLTQDGLRR